MSSLSGAPSTSLTTAQAVARSIEALILDAALAPGDKLPSERQLMARLGVSRAMVREALKSLQGQGVIETRHGQGSFVCDTLAKPEDNEPLMQLFLGHNRTLYDVYEVREQLEGQAAALAAERGSEQDFYWITKAFNAMKDEKDPQRLAERDHAFHQAIVEASHNGVLVHILSSLKGLVQHSVAASVYNLSHRDAFKPQMDKHHQQIWQAITRRQPVKAQRAARAHVRYVAQSLRDIEVQEQSIIRASELL
ncbi:FCD domain-containing protein [Oceanospirillum sediminis]|uniref:FCD domain-containing protein n=1 Tax=Oceanospirillum sediminis TaxID=2760088 RepID=A0A839IS49_9GAMM|nr:FCD domain-containing protein [Oceanospirillum sediminis]MBB1487798.1 FCD domain-containing protein [Oceanospirillum sediminis]